MAQFGFISGERLVCARPGMEQLALLTLNPNRETGHVIDASNSHHEKHNSQITSVDARIAIDCCRFIYSPSFSSCDNSDSLANVTGTRNLQPEKHEEQVQNDRQPASHNLFFLSRDRLVPASNEIGLDDEQFSQDECSSL
jgi:hypothetical protein